MKQEYNFSEGTIGNYYKKYNAGSNIVVLDPEVSSVFTNSDAINEALSACSRT